MNADFLTEFVEELETNKQKIVALEKKYLALLELPRETSLDGVSVVNHDLEALNSQIEKLRNRNVQLSLLIDNQGSDVTIHTEYL